MSGELVDTERLNALTFPMPAVDVPTADAVPLNTLIQALQLAASDGDRKTATAEAKKWDADTPASMQVIKSGSLEITKHVTKLLKRFGGIGGFLTAVAGVITGFMDDVGTPVTVALLGGAAVLLSAVAIALAIVVKGDLEARGIATAARHEGRAAVAASFLEATAGMPSRKRDDDEQASLVSDLLAVIAAYPKTVVTTTRNPGQWQGVKEIARFSPDTKLALTLEHDVVGLDEITAFKTAP